MPKTILTATPQTAVVGAPVTLDGSQSTGAIRGWAITFGDGDDTGDNPLPIEPVEHVYTTAGTYTPRLELRGKNGNTRETTCTVVVTAVVEEPPPPPPPAPVDCVLSDWTRTRAGAWSLCIDGQQTRDETWERTVLTPPANGGAPCGPLQETRTAIQACAILPPPPPPPSGEGHAYFDALAARPECIASYSLRDQAQLSQYAQTHSKPFDVNYLYPNDPDPRKQDAAKVIIPTFVDVSDVHLSADVDAVTITIPTIGGSPSSPRTALKIDDEVMVIVSGSAGVLTVTRGQMGTTAASHTAGALILYGTNSVQNQVWLPFPGSSQDGHTYLTTWDAWFGSETKRASSGLINWKTFQFRRMGNSPAIWFEVRTRFDQAPTANDVAQIDGRMYGAMGPNIIRAEPLWPITGTIPVPAETWVRYWVLIDQRANDWELVTMWAASPVSAPTLIYDRIQMQLATLDGLWNGLHSFQLEFNTSTDALQPGRPPLVCYVRNVVMLRDVANVSAVLVKPS